MDAEISARVIELAAEQGGVEPSQVTRETHFINDLAYDSLAKVEFAMALEDEFELSVPDEVADQFTTVGSVIDFINDQERKGDKEDDSQIASQA